MVYLQTWHGTPLKRIGLRQRALAREPGGARRRWSRDVGTLGPPGLARTRSAPRSSAARSASRGRSWRRAIPATTSSTRPTATTIRAACAARAGHRRRADGSCSTPRRGATPDRRADGAYRFTPAARPRRGSPRRSATATCCCCACTTSVRAPLGDLGPHVRNVSDLPRHRRALPGRRRAGHRLLVGDVRLRGHRQADGLLHLRPRRLPRQGPGLLLRPGGRGARAAVRDQPTSSARRCCDVEGDAERYAGAYARFRERFCPFDDGRASARVVERVFGRLLGSDA